MVNELRLLLRSWKRSPGFPLTAISVIAVGVGLCTAIVSLILSIAFPPVPYPRPEELVEVWATSHPQYETPADYLVPERAFAWEREPNRTLAGAAVVASTLACALIVFVLANGNLATLMLLRVGRNWRDASCARLLERRAPN